MSNTQDELGLRQHIAIAVAKADVDKVMALAEAYKDNAVKEARIDELKRTMPHTDGMRHYNTVVRRIAELEAERNKLKSEEN